MSLEKLGKKLASGLASIDEVAQFVTLLMPDAVAAIVTQFAPRQLAKRARDAEPLPVDPRQLSSYRTRIGTMLEYALSTNMDAKIKSIFGDNLRLTFAVAHEYPDFYVRDAVLGPRIRIEMKAVDAASDEQAARFEVLSSLIQGTQDVVVLLGWEWRAATLPNGTNYEYPDVFSFVVVPAADLAGERDRSVVLRGGRVDADKILVPSKKNPKVLKEDEGNAGKILRLVHTSRKAEAFRLSDSIQKYLQFTQDVVGRAEKVKGLQAAVTAVSQKRKTKSQVKP